MWPSAVASVGGSYLIVVPLFVSCEPWGNFLADLVVGRGGGLHATSNKDELLALGLAVQLVRHGGHRISRVHVADAVDIGLLNDGCGAGVGSTGRWVGICHPKVIARVLVDFSNRVSVGVTAGTSIDGGHGDCCRADRARERDSLLSGVFLGGVGRLDDPPFRNRLTAKEAAEGKLDTARCSDRIYRLRSGRRARKRLRLTGVNRHGREVVR